MTEQLYFLPIWSDDSLKSRGLFYRDVQDINIYVEDENSEIFYDVVFKTLINSDIKIKKIIPLNGRDNVIEFSRNYTDSKPALFIIDGDLYLARGERIKDIERLYEHDRYCIENFLFSLDGLVEIIFETVAKKTKEEIINEINWQSINENIEESLIDLFIEFAIINKIDYKIKTVKIGVDDLFVSKSIKDYLISKQKVDDLIKQKRLELILRNGLNYNKISKDYNTIKASILENLEGFENKLCIISGKHFLMGILFRILKKHAVINPTMDSFKLRLAKYYNKESLSSLKKAIEDTAKGMIYVNKSA